MSMTPETTLPMIQEAPDPATQEQAQQRCTPQKPFVTPGQRIHKWGTYLSVDWIFNAMTGVSFAYWGKFTESGKRMWSGPISRGFKAALTPFIKHPENVAKSAEYGNIFMSIIAGGMFTLPPLLVLESKKCKKHIAQTADKALFGEEKVENDPQFQASYDAIDEAPKKDFSRGLTSRFTALAPLLAMVLIPTTRRISDKLWFNHVANASEAVAGKMGFSPASFKSISAAEAKDRWTFIHKSVAMDFGLGVPYAVMHAFFYNKFVAARDKTQAKQGDNTPAFAAELDALEQLASAAPPAEQCFTDKHPRKEASIKPVAKPVPAAQFTDYAARGSESEKGVAI